MLCESTEDCKPSVQVKGGELLSGYRDEMPCAECRGGEPLLRCPEVENLGPGKVDVCVNLY